MSALSDALNAANVDGLSVREIARRGGDRVHHSALGKYFKPVHGHPTEDVLEVFHQVLGIPLERLRELAGYPAGHEEPYQPPREANRLDRRQRRVLDELIRMLAETKAGEGDVQRDTPPHNQKQPQHQHRHRARSPGGGGDAAGTLATSPRRRRAHR